jgi:ferric-dicitrate binding protein FerR (iron transport regulator)
MKTPDEALRESMLRYLEGGLAEEDLARLSLSLRTDEAARREMAELLLQEVHLSRIAEEAAGAERKPASKSTTRIGVRKVRRSPRRAHFAAAVAAGVLLGIVLFFAVRPGPPAGRPPEPAPAITLSPQPAAPPPPEPRPLPQPPPAYDPPKAPEAPRPPLEEPRPAIAAPPPRPDSAPPPAVRETPKPRAPEPAAPAPAEPTIARIERVQGEVQVLSGPVRTPARAGQNLAWGQGLEAGPRAAAVLKYSDGTRVELGSGAVLWEASDRPARGEESPKRLFLAAGALSADVARQQPGRPMALVTPHGEAKVLGTSLRLVVEPASTRLELKEGRVRLTRKEDQAAVEVSAGHYAVLAKGVPLEARPLVPTGSTTPKGSGSR